MQQKKIFSYLKKYESNVMLPKSGATCRDRITSPIQKRVHRQNKKEHIIVKPIHSSLRPESKTKNVIITLNLLFINLIRIPKFKLLTIFFNEHKSKLVGIP